MAKSKNKTGKFIGGKPVLHNCSYCTKKFFEFKSQKRKFCSKICGIMNRTKYPKEWTCMSCGVHFKKDISSSVRKFCSNKCYGKSRIGTSISEGHKMVLRRRMKENNPMKNPITAEIVRLKQTQRRLTPEQRVKKSVVMKQKVGGENNWRWKGGVIRDNLIQSIRKSFPYRLWRESIYKRDNFSCQECGVTKTSIHVHHIVRLCDIIDMFNIKTLEDAIQCQLLWHISNGITLCLECHNRKHYSKNNMQQIKTGVKFGANNSKPLPIV